MHNIQKYKINLCLLLLFVQINLSLSKTNYSSYPMEIAIDGEDLKPFIIHEKWIPSLLSPILLVSPYEKIYEGKLETLPISNIRSYFKRLNSDAFTVVLFNIMISKLFWGKPLMTLFRKAILDYHQEIAFIMD